MHTSALAKLVDDLLNRPSPVLPQVLFARNLVNRRVPLVTGQFAAGVCESGEDDTEGGTVAQN